MNGRLLTVSEASEEFFVPEKTIRTWIERGRLSWFQPGLVLEEDVVVVELQTRRMPRWQRLLALTCTDEASSAAGPRISKPCRSVTSVQV